MMRLSRATLRDLPASVGVPAYDLDAVCIGHAHLGVGAFHRAHQAEYADDLLADGAGACGILGINLRAPDLAAMLAPQDGLYTSAARDGTDERLRVLGAIRRVVMSDGDPRPALAVLADPAITVVTLTVTEKGYCHVPASGELEDTHPDIVHDLREPATPRSVPGFLVDMLTTRRARGVTPPALLSCDNIAGNGRVLRAVVTAVARRRDPGLADWIEGEVAFPCSMVDRIVPAPGDADRARVSAALGVRDEAAVVGEPFRQWVIEDGFRARRPPWERAGAELVADVRPHEAMKMRLLNGCQSALAALGWLGGCVHTVDAMAVPALAGFVRDLMAHESGPTLGSMDLKTYQSSVLRRLANPALRHTTWQIATDGSQKLPPRLLAPLRARLADGAPFERLALAVAAWMQFASGRDLAGAPIAVPDVLATDLLRAGQCGREAGGLVEAMLRVTAVFGDDLHRSPQARATITRALELLRDVGTIEAARIVGEGG